MAPFCTPDGPALLRERSSASASSSSLVLFALAFFALPFFLGVSAASRAEVRPLRDDGLGARCDAGVPRCDAGGPRCEIGGRAGLLFRGVGIWGTTRTRRRGSQDFERESWNFAPLHIIFKNEFKNRELERGSSPERAGGGAWHRAQGKSSSFQTFALTDATSEPPPGEV